MERGDGARFPRMPPPPRARSCPPPWRWRSRSSRRRAIGRPIREASPLAFYVAATILMWWVALGPDPKVGRRSVGGARSLSALDAGARLREHQGAIPVLGDGDAVDVDGGGVRRGRPGLRARRTAMSGVLVGVLSLGVLSDGWELHMPWATVPPGPPNPTLLRGQQVLYLPAGNITDVRPTFYGVSQGWRAVNGYSGFEPNHYDGVRQASKFELDGLFTAFTETTDLHVWVAADAPRMREVVERQPGAVRTGTSASATQYVVPSRSRTVAVPRGTPATVAGVSSSCPPAQLLSDRDLEGIWTCAPQDGSETITLTLGRGGAPDGASPDPGSPGGVSATCCLLKPRSTASVDGRSPRGRGSRVHSRGDGCAHATRRGAGHRAPRGAIRPPAAGGTRPHGGVVVARAGGTRG